MQNFQFINFELRKNEFKSQKLLDYLDTTIYVFANTHPHTHLFVSRSIWCQVQMLNHLQNTNAQVNEILNYPTLNTFIRVFKL